MLKARARLPDLRGADQNGSCVIDEGMNECFRETLDSEERLTLYIFIF